MPAVSIIIPTYDRAELMSRTLASVCSQTFADYEVIVVDDGSADDTEMRVRGVDPRLRCVRIEHSGPGAARNAGLALAGGRYVAFLDSDDWWDQRFLEEMVSGLESCPRAGFAYCDYAMFAEMGDVEPACLGAGHKRGGRLFTALLEEDFLSTGALLIRRECFERAGRFDAGLTVAEDWDLWLRIARLYDAVYVNEVLLHIRQDPCHAGRNPELVYTCNLRVLAKIRQNSLAEDRSSRALIRRQEVRFHRALLDYYRLGPEKSKAFRELAYLAQAQLRFGAER